MFGSLGRKIAGSALGNFVGGNLFWIIPSVIALFIGIIGIHLWWDAHRFKELERLRTASMLFETSQASKQRRILQLQKRLDDANDEKLQRIAQLEREVVLMREAAEEIAQEQTMVAEAFAQARLEVERLKVENEEFANWGTAPFPDARWRVVRDTIGH